MKNSVLNLQVSSPEELDRVLAADAGDKTGNAQLAALNLYGRQILVRQFDFPPLSRLEIVNALKLEAAEIFSLPPEEIEIDYQITDSSKSRIKGVFMGIPSAIFDGYVLRLNKIKLPVDKITANIFSRINHFLNENKLKCKDFCIIDFFKASIMNLAVFTDGKCGILREIQYSNLGDAEREIAYSLKYASSKSTNKKCNEVYALGDLSDKNGSIESLERDLNVAIKKFNVGPRMALSPSDSFFNINLMKKYNFPASLQKTILFLVNLALAACLALFLVSGVKTIKQYRAIKGLSGSFNESDYNYARGLQEELTLLKNAK